MVNVYKDQQYLKRGSPTLTLEPIDAIMSPISFA